MSRIREGQAFEFFRQLAAKSADEIMSAIQDPDATLLAIARCPDHGGLGRKFSEEAVRDTLTELEILDASALLGKIQDTRAVMDIIDLHEQLNHSGTCQPMYGAAFPHPRRKP